MLVPTSDMISILLTLHRTEMSEKKLLVSNDVNEKDLSNFHLDFFFYEYSEQSF